MALQKAGFSSLVFIMLLVPMSTLHAETIDYGNLQELFGEPVTTSATGKPQKASEAPVALEIITADKIRRSGATSIPEILNRITGVTTWQATRSFADVGVRGQNTAYNPTLLVLLNGRQVYIDVYGYTDWSLIPVQLEEIRQIEIVKGPTTALYGFNAVSGVVNIVTYNPQYDKVSQAGLVGGTDHYGRIYGYKTLKFSDKASVRLSGSIEKFNEFDDGSKTQYAPISSFRDANNKKLLVDSLFQLTDHTQLRLEGSYADSWGTDTPPGFTAIPTKKDFWSGKVSVSSETDIGLVETNLYTNHFANDYDGYLDAGIVDNQITSLQVQDLFKVGTNHSFRLQGEYRHNRMESSLFIGPAAHISYDVIATGGMWNWVITPAIEWTNAVRIDHLMLKREGPIPTPVPYTSNNDYNQSITDVSVNSGVVWKATNKDTLRASYGRGIQAPSLVQFGTNISFVSTSIFAGNPNLSPVVVDNYEVGYDRAIQAIGGKFRNSLFYKRTRNIHDFSGRVSLSGNTVIAQSAETGSSDTAGIELGLEGTVGSKWSWDVSYIYQTTDDDFIPLNNQSPTPLATHYQDTIPHHVLKAHLGYATGPWELDIYGEAASAFDTVEASGGAGYLITNSDGYHTLSGRVGYKSQNNIILAVHGMDITQDSVANNYGLRNERRMFISLSRKF